MLSWLGGLISDLIGGTGKALVDVIKGILGGAVVFLTDIVNSLGGIIDILDGVKNGIGGLYQGFLALLSIVFPFLPEEWISILVTSLLMTIVGLIIKKKVFE